MNRSAPRSDTYGQVARGPCSRGRGIPLPAFDAPRTNETPAEAMPQRPCHAPPPVTHRQRGSPIARRLIHASGTARVLVHLGGRGIHQARLAMYAAAGP